MTYDLKKKLLMITTDTKGSDRFSSGEEVWEICNQAAFKLSELESSVSLMKKSFITEVTAAVDCEYDDDWNKWGVDMMGIMNYTNDELGYKTGESERIALAYANSDLRSELLALRSDVVALVADIRNFLETAMSSSSEETSQILDDALTYLDQYNENV